MKCLLTIHLSESFKDSSKYLGKPCWLQEQTVLTILRCLATKKLKWLCIETMLYFVILLAFHFKNPNCGRTLGADTQRTCTNCDCFTTVKESCFGGLKCSRTKGLKRSGGQIYEPLKKLSHKPTDQLCVVCWQEVTTTEAFCPPASHGGHVSPLCLLRQQRSESLLCVCTWSSWSIFNPLQTNADTFSAHVSRSPLVTHYLTRLLCSTESDSPKLPEANQAFTHP